MTEQVGVAVRVSSWEKIKRASKERRVEVRRWIWTVMILTFFTGGGFAWTVAKKNYLSMRMTSETLQAENLKLQSQLQSKNQMFAYNQFLQRQELKLEIKQELSAEMGLFSLDLLRRLKSSFVELNSFDREQGESAYGTAAYLGRGYFLTVKHAVIVLDNDAELNSTPFKEIMLNYHGQKLAAKVIDHGDAKSEVNPGDWAILKVASPVDILALKIDTNYAFEFADSIARLGNDYSKGIIVTTGLVGQHTSNDLVTCLIDGHPGVSGGGVLNLKGDLVGIPVGRMQGDYRFSFILPVRAEMFRKVHLKE